jgi:hypothetical protein
MTDDRLATAARATGEAIDEAYSDRQDHSSLAQRLRASRGPLDPFVSLAAKKKYIGGGNLALLCVEVENERRDDDG